MFTINSQIYDKLSDSEKLDLLEIYHILPDDVRMFIQRRINEIIKSSFKSKINLHHHSVYAKLLDPKMFKPVSSSIFATIERNISGISHFLEMNAENELIRLKLNKLAYHPYYNEETIINFHHECEEVCNLLINTKHVNATALIKTIVFDLAVEKIQAYSILDKIIYGIINIEFPLYTVTDNRLLNTIVRIRQILSRFSNLEQDLSVNAKDMGKLLYQLYKLTYETHITRFLYLAEEVYGTHFYQEVLDEFNSCLSNSETYCESTSSLSKMYAQDLENGIKLNLNIIEESHIGFNEGNSIVFGDPIINYNETDIIYNIVRESNESNINRYHKCVSLDIPEEDLMMLKDLDIKYATILTKTDIDKTELAHICKHDDDIYILFKGPKSSLCGISVATNDNCKNLIEINKNNIEYTYKYDV